MVENSQLHWVPLLCVNLFEVDFARLEESEENVGAGHANEHAEVELEMRGLVPQAVDAIGVPWIVIDLLLKQRLEFL